MSIEKSIERFRKAKERIRQAIISKEIDVPEGASLSEMATKIEEIKVGKSNKRKEKDNAE
jgi:mannose/fructose/N-acetylgalactosamine-specific phosphotransferase system component IIB